MDESEIDLLIMLLMKTNHKRALRRLSYYPVSIQSKKVTFEPNKRIEWA